jgi:hypothetical protein
MIPWVACRLRHPRLPCGLPTSLLLALLASCGREEPSPPPAPPPPPPEPALPAPAALSFPDWSEVDDEKVPALPPAETGPLRWNFAAGRRAAYDFSQTLSQRAEYVLEGQGTSIDSRERNRGTFDLVAGKDRTALVRIRIETEEQVVNDRPVPLEESAPSLCDAILQEGGAAEIKQQKGRADGRLFFEAILRVAAGRKDFQDGAVETRAAGRFKIERHECVRLETEFEFRSKKPSEEALLRGRSIGYFAPSEGRFIRSSTAAVTSTRRNDRNAKGDWVTTQIDARTSMRLRALE